MTDQLLENPALDDDLVSGHVAPGFENVRERFAENLRNGSEVGASFAVIRKGEVLVDLWGGHADAERTRPVASDSIFNLWSATKGVAAIVIAVLVERGKLDYEAPVARYWPEFAASGKEAVTVGELMSHQAGLCGAREPITIEDLYAHTPVAAKLAAQEPFWKPGQWGYHPITYGTLADELVRRVDGRSIGAFFSEEIAGPLGLDIHMGVPEAEHGRVVDLIPPKVEPAVAIQSPNPEAAQACGQNPALEAEWCNTRAWRIAGLAGAGGHANARGLARLYDIFINRGALGRQALSAENFDAATRERIAGTGQVSGLFGRYAAGFALNVESWLGPGARSFGHPGWGGSVGFADPVRGIGVGYVISRMLNPTGLVLADPRAARLLEATYEALDEETT